VVCGAGKTGLDGARMGVRASLDSALCAHRGGRMAGLARCGNGRGARCVDCAARVQRRAVVRDVRCTADRPRDGDHFALWLAIVAFMVLALPASRTAVLLFLPYLAWVSYATLLNIRIWQLN